MLFLRPGQALAAGRLLVPPVCVVLDRGKADARGQLKAPGHTHRLQAVLRLSSLSAKLARDSSRQAAQGCLCPSTKGCLTKRSMLQVGKDGARINNSASSHLGVGRALLLL